jgi:hypothetical protein
MDVKMFRSDEAICAGYSAQLLRWHQARLKSFVSHLGMIELSIDETVAQGLGDGFGFRVDL